MAKTASDARQAELAMPIPGPRPGSLNIGLELRNLLGRAIKDCPLSRAEIAAKMTDLAYGDASDKEITKSQVDGWTAPSHEAWRFPLELLPAFVIATGAIDLLDFVAERCGAQIVAGDQALLAELGAITLQERRLKARQEQIRKRVSNERVVELLSRLNRLA